MALRSVAILLVIGTFWEEVDPGLVLSVALLPRATVGLCVSIPSVTRTLSKDGERKEGEEEKRKEMAPYFFPQALCESRCFKVIILLPFLLYLYGHV